MVILIRLGSRLRWDYRLLKEIAFPSPPALKFGFVNQP